MQEEATARAAADEAIENKIPTKTSQLTNDSGFLTKAGKIDNALSADFASSVQWTGVADKPIASASELGLVKVGSNLTIDADGTLNAAGGGTGGVSQEYVDGKVQDEATARQNADEQLKASIDKKADLSSVPTKTSQLTNDSGFLTKTGTIDNALSADKAKTAETAAKADTATTASSATTAATATTADSASSVPWTGVQDTPTSLTGYGITDAATKAELDSLAAVVGAANTQLEEIA